ncbi:MAG TPA: hypothetical protein ENJ82_08555 [Bacteroidetes bacterium]|nr:hypothetical protein [Bacteroidota bacterium]
MKEKDAKKSEKTATRHNARAVPSSPLHNASSVMMRQSSELYRQTVIRYDDEEIGGLLTPDSKA